MTNKSTNHSTDSSEIPVNSTMDVIFGLHAVTSMIEQHVARVQEICISKDRKDKRVQKIIELAREKSLKIKFMDRRVFEQCLAKIEGEKKHQGVFVRCSQVETFDEQDLSRIINEKVGDKLFLVLDGVTDPHNLGACLRSADAAGVDAVIVPKDKSAALNSTAVKVACGAAETVPLIKVTNLSRTLKELQDQGVWVYGTAGEAKETIYDTNMKGSVALVMGAEGDGMRRLTRDSCDHLIKLPMAGSVSSLNVSVATGVCLFEIVRQRIA
jgi:23S rRNA (guanosine2251-2'-O)-methyltransferase